mgnify:CR=1 FL=1
MTPIEAIYEIKAAVVNLERYLSSKDAVVSKKARVKYEQLVNVFFRDNKGSETSKHRQECLNDQDFFMKLMDESVECYYLDLEG